jgi:hypothetical protein
MVPVSVQAAEEGSVRCALGNGRGVRDGKFEKKQHLPDVGLTAMSHACQSLNFQARATAEFEHDALVDRIPIFAGLAQINGKRIEVRRYLQVHQVLRGMNFALTPAG